MTFSHQKSMVTDCPICLKCYTYRDFFFHHMVNPIWLVHGFLNVLNGDYFSNSLICLKCYTWNFFSSNGKSNLPYSWFSRCPGSWRLVGRRGPQTQCPGQARTPAVRIWTRNSQTSGWTPQWTLRCSSSPVRLWMLLHYTVCILYTNFMVYI